jgi:hypothetical protein
MVIRNVTTIYYHHEIFFLYCFGSKNCLLLNKLFLLYFCLYSQSLVEDKHSPILCM